MQNNQSRNLSRSTLSGQPLPEGNHTPYGQSNGGYHQNQPNPSFGGGTYNSAAPHIKSEPMETTTPSSIAKQEPIKTIKEEFKPHIKDEPKFYIKEEPKPSIKDDTCITVSIRGQGNQTKALNIQRTMSLDEFISEVNSLFGFGRNSTDTYIIFNGKQLSRGTQTVGEAGLRDKSSVELCVRTRGG